MARLRAFSAFDMRSIVPSAAAVSLADGAITAVAGARTTTVTGDFDARATGVSGTVLAFGQTLAGRAVFAATGIERSAATALAILEDRDNDRFLAYTLSGDDAISGSAAVDYLIGFGGEDTLFGGGGNDSLFGGSDRDTLDGGAGADFLAGGKDGDLMRGASGDDTYLVADSSDLVVEAAGGGLDSILSYVSRVLPAQVERLVLIGTDAINGKGGGAADVIDGNEAANLIAGGDGRDDLDGDGGNDTLEGGNGRDLLNGGGGADHFRFRSAAEANGDTIQDFTRAADRIDLARIDANAAASGDQAFRFLGEAAFTGRAGELSTLGTVVRGDLDGDGLADFALRLEGDPALGAADFLL
jgi:Ca2+-binding RTX toxin-like protein